MNNRLKRISVIAMEDASISLKAKGIIACALIKNSEKGLREEDLLKISSDGTSSVHAGIVELCNAGYFKKTSEKLSNGRFSKVYYEFSDEKFA